MNKEEIIQKIHKAAAQVVENIDKSRYRMIPYERVEEESEWKGRQITPEEALKIQKEEEILS